ncbi:hypothetical protein C7H19_22865 [Aphanothece hegewaldii CCALA 016]|uniref:Uncharacterized protein n=1 Tax=Aphanothece hegewaldii CCALA 016 TaxID=2107694 RepID=A0A2T1LRK2_9CHRO|nr:hypothetical protein C7H19_22865 [Aphanothece hegewaldii CCALA 016]
MLVLLKFAESADWVITAKKDSSVFVSEKVHQLSVYSLIRHNLINNVKYFVTNICYFSECLLDDLFIKIYIIYIDKFKIICMKIYCLETKPLHFVD